LSHPSSLQLTVLEDEAFQHPESILSESETQFRLSSFTEIPSRADAILMKFPRWRSDDAYTELRRPVYRGNIKVNNDQDLFVWNVLNLERNKNIAFQIATNLINLIFVRFFSIFYVNIYLIFINSLRSVYDNSN